MLIPRYSIRWLLGLTTVSAGVSLVLSYAVRGEAWAIGVTSALWAFVALAFFYVSAFLCAWLIDQTAAKLVRSRQQAGSPFAVRASGDSPIDAASPQPAADSPPSMTG